MRSLLFSIVTIVASCTLPPAFAAGGHYDVNTDTEILILASVAGEPGALLEVAESVGKVPAVASDPAVAGWRGLDMSDPYPMVASRASPEPAYSLYTATAPPGNGDGVRVARSHGRTAFIMRC